jgi:hypothetical protein
MNLPFPFSTMARDRSRKVIILFRTITEEEEKLRKKILKLLEASKNYFFFAVQRFPLKIRAYKPSTENSPHLKSNKTFVENTVFVLEDFHCLSRWGTHGKRLEKFIKEFARLFRGFD